MLIQNGNTVLFQGDSITDCGRNRQDIASLGGGYAAYIAALFQARYANMDVQFVNKGVSGERVINLAERWQADCLDIKPDVLSILIGVNDTWRRYDSNSPTSAEAYEEGYRAILTRARETLCCKLVIIEPFLLHVTPERAAWREDLDPKIHAARKLAREFGAVYVPMDGIFAAASAKKEPAFWAADGVHPTAAGHMLIAEEWMRAIV